MIVQYTNLNSTESIVRILLVLSDCAKNNLQERE